MLPWRQEAKGSLTFDLELQAEFLRREMLREDGWRDWTGTPPPNSGLIQVIKIAGNQWEQPFIVTPSELHPTFNIASLWWRPTGIGRIQMECAE